MKLNMNVFITLGLIAVIGIAVTLFLINKKNNYQIEITAVVGGTDEFGNTLDGTRKKYKYSVKNNITFYETYSNQWTTNNKETSIGEIITIKKLNKKNAIVETVDGKVTIEYGKEKSINSLMFVADGLNCVYYYKII